VLNGNQLDPRVGWGYELNAIRHRVRNSACDVEARYFAVYGNNATVGPFNVPAGSVGLYATPVLYGAPSVTTAAFSSQLQNFELNVRRFRGPSVQLLGGFRWVELDDYFTITDNFPAPVAGVTTQRTSVINRLFGAQIGADVFLWQRNRLSIDGIGKAGIYGNAISSNLLITQTTPGALNFQSAASGGQTAFVGELGLTGRYRLTNNCSLRATYQLLWLDGVARGTDQVPNYNLAVAPATGPAAITTNTVFYNGMFMGAESQF
jgi:hypothetical protein